MFKITLLFFAGIFISGGWSADVVNLTFVYEAKWYGCLKFINDQFYPGYGQVGSYINLTLLPYTIYPNKYVESCQNGGNECFITKAQVCAFRNVSQQLQVDFLHCTEAILWDEEEHRIKRYDVTEDDIKACLANVLPEVSWSDVQVCMYGGEANELLTAAFKQVMDSGVLYVPSLIFNGIHDFNLEQLARDNFVSAICSLLSNKPEVCK